MSNVERWDPLGAELADVLDPMRESSDAGRRARRELELASSLTPAPTIFGRRCPYCGTKIGGSARACPSHRDLLELDAGTSSDATTATFTRWEDS